MADNGFEWPKDVKKYKSRQSFFCKLSLIGLAVTMSSLVGYRLINRSLSIVNELYEARSAVTSVEGKKRALEHVFSYPDSRIEPELKRMSESQPYREIISELELETDDARNKLRVLEEQVKDSPELKDYKKKLDKFNLFVICPGLIGTFVSLGLSARYGRKKYNAIEESIKNNPVGSLAEYLNNL